MTTSIDKVNNSLDSPTSQASESSFLDKLLNAGGQNFRTLTDYNLRKLQIKSLAQQQFAAGATVPVKSDTQPVHVSFFTTRRIEYIGLGLLAVVAAVVILKGK